MTSLGMDDKSLGLDDFLSGPGLTSEMFISSISASVGALSSTRGLDGARGPGSDADRSMQEVDFTLQGQGRMRQGMEPNAEGGGEAGVRRGEGGREG